VRTFQRLRARQNSRRRITHRTAPEQEPAPRLHPSSILSHGPTGRTRSIDAVIANLSGQAAAVVAGAPKGRNRTVSFQSKKDSIFDKYRECVVFLSLRSFFLPTCLSPLSISGFLSHSHSQHLTDCLAHSPTRSNALPLALSLTHALTLTLTHSLTHTDQFTN
jgi:hypothetical protein